MQDDDFTTRRRRWRPERVALVLAVIAVATGTIATGVRVADGIDDARVEYRGKLDVGEILRSFHPTGPSGVGDPLPRIRRMGHGYLSEADGVMSAPQAGGGLLAAWALAELAPWLLAALVLALLAPIVRAAERGDPFRRDATRRLTAAGTALLTGLPAIAVFSYLVAESASAGRTFVSPGATPTLTISVAHVLPGLLLLVLAGVFRKGAELREFERHAI